MQYTERSHYRDFDDIESIIDALGCNYNTIEELVGWFRSQGIRLHDFPNVYSWVFQWGGKVRIEGPEDAVTEYKEIARKALEG